MKLDGRMPEGLEQRVMKLEITPVLGGMSNGKVNCINGCLYIHGRCQSCRAKVVVVLESQATIACVDDLCKFLQ